MILRKNPYKVTEEIREQLTNISAQFKPQPKMKKIVNQVSGASLLLKGIRKVRNNGKVEPVIFGKKYLQENIQIHQNKDFKSDFIEIYKRFGILGVIQLINSINTNEQIFREVFPQLYDGEMKNFESFMVEQEDQKKLSALINVVMAGSIPKKN